MAISWLSLALLVVPCAARDATTTNAPPLNPARQAYSLEWCDCGEGLASVTVYPEGGNASAAVTVPLGDSSPHWFRFDDGTAAAAAAAKPVSKIFWKCDGMEAFAETKFSSPQVYWSVQHTLESKGGLTCGKAATGRLRVVGWSAAPYATSVPYASGEGGYGCIKIPVLLRLRSGSLLAIAEARVEGCSDFANTDLVQKTSTDGGASWGALAVIRTARGPGLPPTVIGNAAPVQLGEPAAHGGVGVAGRIVLPHTRNNSDTWVTHSDDDGATWAPATPLGANGTVPGQWNWVATGPPGALQLRSGRILVPMYHGQNRGNIANNKVHGNVLLSDDGGGSWRLASQSGFGAADKYSNENQAVELRNGSVLINARALANTHDFRRIQTRSDDGGETFGPTRYVPELPQPIDGCEGSTVVVPRDRPAGAPRQLVFSGPDSTLFRTKMTLWTSDDEGASWQTLAALDGGSSGYSSLQIECPADAATPCDALLLYEQSDGADIPVQNPDRFIFRRIPLKV